MKDEQKNYAFREPVQAEFRMWHERIELWLVRHGLCTVKMWAKWHRTVMEEIAESIEIDTSKIHLAP